MLSPLPQQLSLKNGFNADILAHFPPTNMSYHEFYSQAKSQGNKDKQSPPNSQNSTKCRTHSTRSNATNDLIDNLEFNLERITGDNEAAMMESEKAFLETLDYVINSVVPNLTAPDQKTAAFVQKPSDKYQTSKMKSLLGNLMTFLKHNILEVNLMTMMKNVLNSHKKPSGPNLLKEGVKTMNKKIKKMTKERHFQCRYENCYKVYTTRGGLAFHIKNKHKKAEILKKKTALKEKAKKQNAQISNAKPKRSTQKTVNHNVTLIKETIEKPKPIVVANTEKIEFQEDNESQKKSVILSTTAFTKDMNVKEEHVSQSSSSDQALNDNEFVQVTVPIECERSQHIFDVVENPLTEEMINFEGRTHNSLFNPTYEYDDLPPHNMCYIDSGIITSNEKDIDENSGYHYLMGNKLHFHQDVDHADDFEYQHDFNHLHSHY